MQAADVKEESEKQNRHVRLREREIKRHERAVPPAQPFALYIIILK